MHQLFTTKECTRCLRPDNAFSDLRPKNASAIHDQRMHQLLTTKECISDLRPKYALPIHDQRMHQLFATRECISYLRPMRMLASISFGSVPSAEGAKTFFQLFRVNAYAGSAHGTVHRSMAVPVCRP